MGCCEYKNVSYRFSEVSEISQTDSVSRISEKNNNNFSPEGDRMQKSASNLSLKLKKVTYGGEEKKFQGEDEQDYYDKKQQGPFIPLSEAIQEKGMSS